MKKQIILFIIICVFNINAFGQSVPSYIPTNGLVGWYPFTGNTNDVSGSGNNGIAVGASLTTDRFGNSNSAYYFNGTTDHISIPTNFFDVGWNGFTISCWSNTSNLTNPNNANQSQPLFNSRPHHGIALDFNWGASNKYSVWVNSNPSSSGWDIFNDASSNNNATTNTWNNMVMVKNGTNYYLYINGILDKTYTNSTVPISYLCQMVIGQTDSTISSETFFGKLDDFGMWNRALTSSEINQVFQSNLASIKSNASISNIRVYPNPANNILNFEYEKSNKITEVKITNVIGEDVRKENVGDNEGKLRVDISNLTNGIYFVTLSNGKESFIEKIIVNK
jgi:hypothetical protein